MNDNTAAIRQFLRNRFSDEELTTLSSDYFRDVYQDFSSGMTKGQKIQLLLDYCQRRDQLSSLLAILARERPKQYQAQFTLPTRVEARAAQPQPGRDPRQIFISHAHEDAEFAQLLAADLQERGWIVWIAPSSIRPGEKWVEAIGRGLDESGVFVLVVTPNAVESEWVRSETGAAIELEHKGEVLFIPLQVETAEAPSLWRVYQYISFQSGYADGLEALLAKLELTEAPSPQPAELPSSEAWTARLLEEVVRLPREEKDILYAVLYSGARRDIDASHYQAVIRLKELGFLDIHSRWLSPREDKLIVSINESAQDVVEKYFRAFPETTTDRRAEPEEQTIEEAKSTGKYYSCFISYSSKDQAFAEKLHADLQRHGVNVWFAPEDMPIGAKTRIALDESILEQHKLLLILSQHSVASDWVEQEVETSLEKERDTGQLVLFPIRIDDAVMNLKAGWAAHIKRTRNIGDFRQWKETASYQRWLQRTLRDLKVATGQNGE